MTGQNPSNTPQKYNKVYESLVKNQNDIVGFIAYGLYKKSKQEYITTFEKNFGKRPTSDELTTHVLCSEIPSLEAYRKEAEQTLEFLLEQAVSEKEAELEKNFQRNLWKYVKNYEPPSLLDKFFTFFKSSFSGVMGNFITTAIIILLLYSLSSQVSKENLKSGAKENFVSGIAKVLGVETIKVKPSVVNPTENESGQRK